MTPCFIFIFVGGKEGVIVVRMSVQVGGRDQQYYHSAGILQDNVDQQKLSMAKKLNKIKINKGSPLLGIHQIISSELQAHAGSCVCASWEHA